jgi:hypothetical protein
MKSAMRLSILMGILIAAPAAYADQCAYVTKPQAIAAFNNLNVGQTIYSFCELCGDRSPQPAVIRSLSIANTPSANYWEVLVNGRGIDLAYTYIDYQNEAQQKINLALVANCPAQSFTPLLPMRNTRFSRPEDDNIRLIPPPRRK